MGWEEEGRGERGWKEREADKYKDKSFPGGGGRGGVEGALNLLT